MSTSPEGREPSPAELERLPNESLPPVEPPSAGFIVQLFIIPAVIVSIVIMVWALFNWIAHKGTDPRTFVDQLKRNNESRWQAAFNLANEMRKPGNDPLKRDPLLLAEVAGVLEAESKEPPVDEKSIELRVYLCYALGGFQLPEALPPLIKAASTKRNDKESSVQLAGIQAIAFLLPQIDVEAARRNKELLDVLLKAAGDTDALTRQHAAFALGVLGGDEAVRRLEVMLNDLNVDVRMNAATGLARHGNAACVPELAKMVEPGETEAVLSEQEPAAREFKRLLVYQNGLSGMKQYRQAAPQADVSALVAALDRLLASNPAPKVKLEAEDVRRVLTTAN